MMDWSGILPELLAIIAQKHIVFYEDYASFACVCKSWHSAAKQAAKTHMFSNGPPSRFPSLVLDQKREEKEFRELFLLSNMSSRRIRLPQIYDKYIHVSSCGWFVTIGQDRASQLINPLSRETINLPDVETFESDSLFYLGAWKLHFLSNDSRCTSSPLLALVVVTSIHCHRLRFCRPGDNEWTRVRRGRGFSNIFDNTYYNGLVYCFDKKKYIRAWDVHVKDPTITRMIGIVKMPNNLYHKRDLYHLRDEVYLIGSDDGERKRLLVVIRKTQKYGNSNYKTKRFLVFAYHLDNRKWSQVKDFGTKALFVGDALFWVDGDTTGRRVIKGNCIYFIERVFSDDDDSSDNEDDERVTYMGIYHMSDETIEPHFPGESFSGVIPPTWLQSM